MATSKTVYTCRECGGTSPKWLGKCPHCEAWNTLEEGLAEPAAGASKNRFQALAKSQPVATLSEIEAAKLRRQLRQELDRRFRAIQSGGSDPASSAADANSQA